MKTSYPVKIGFLVLTVALVATGCSKLTQENASAAAGQGAQDKQDANGQSGQKTDSAASGQRDRKAATVPVQAMLVRTGLLSVDRTTAGIITPSIQSQVATQVAGVVLKVNRLAGDWVKAGEVVVQLDDSQLALSLANAEASLENAKINLSMGQDNSTQANPKLALQLQSAQSAYDSAKKFYDAQKALYDLEGISASQLDTAASQLTAAQANLEGAKTSLDQNNKADNQSIAQLKLAVKQAQNQLDQARLNLRNASIRAPFAGQISAINMQQGMYAGLNTPVFTLVSADRHIAFNVAPSDTAYLKIGTVLEFEYGGKSYSARISQSPSSPISGVVPLVATSGVLSFPYGSVGNIIYRIPLAEGILIPIASLATLSNQNFVFVIENGHAIVKNVTIIAESGTYAAVEGIDAGDTVIVSPPPGLIQGSQVQPTMLQSKTSSAGAK